MTIKFRCFNCNSKVEAPDWAGGRRGKCPKCKAKNTIPSLHDTIEDNILTLFEDIENYEDEQIEEEQDII